MYSGGEQEMIVWKNNSDFRNKEEVYTVKIVRHTVFLHNSLLQMQQAAALALIL